MKTTKLKLAALSISLVVAAIYLNSDITEKAVDQGIKLPVNLPSSPDKTHIDNLSREETLEKAVNAIKSTRLDEAKEIYDEILKSEPGNKEALYGMGVLHTKYANYEKATEFLHEAFQADSTAIKRALEDPELVDLRANTAFHNLLRIENEAIPEMHSQMRSAPIPAR